jgi:hypothetical protein
LSDRPTAHYFYAPPPSACRFDLAPRLPFRSRPRASRFDLAPRACHFDLRAMLINVSYDAVHDRAALGFVGFGDVYSSICFEPTTQPDALDAYARALLFLRYGDNFPTEREAIKISMLCVSSRLKSNFESGQYDGLLIRDNYGFVGVCFGCTSQSATYVSDFETNTMVFCIGYGSKNLRPASAYLHRCQMFAPTPEIFSTENLMNSRNARNLEDGWRKLASDVFYDYHSSHTNQGTVVVNMKFSGPAARAHMVFLSKTLRTKFYTNGDSDDSDDSDYDDNSDYDDSDYDVEPCNNRVCDDDGCEGCNLDIRRTCFMFVDKVIDHFIKRSGPATCLDDIAGAISATRFIADTFIAAGVRESCECRVCSTSRRIGALAVWCCDLQDARRAENAAAIRTAADAVAAKLVADETAEKKQRETLLAAALALKSADDEPLPAGVEALRALVNTRTKAMAKAKTVMEKLPKRASKDERKEASARVQRAHTAREAAVNALSRAERAAKELTEREAKRAASDTRAALAARSAAERADRERAEANEASLMLAVQMQRAELRALGVNELIALPTAAMQLAVPVPLPPVPRAPPPVSVPMPVPVPRAPPPPPRAPPRAPTPVAVDVDAEEIEDVESDMSCIVCMDSVCEVTTTCCKRTFMCGSCSTRVARCPLCTAVDFACLPGQL